MRKLSLRRESRASLSTLFTEVFSHRARGREQLPSVSSRVIRGVGAEEGGQAGGGNGVEAICLSRADSFRLQTRWIVCERAHPSLEFPVRRGARRACRGDKDEGRGGGVGA